MEKHLVVIGGGAAGFFAAVNAARMRPGLRVTLLEKSGKLLSKVKISGGGRCNLTHYCFDIDTLAGNYPRGARFVKKAFHHFNTRDTVNWFEERGVELKAEKDGRMFPVSDKVDTIIDCLLREADLYGVKVITHYDVKKIDIIPYQSDDTPGRFAIHSSTGRTIEADYLCIACGGYPKESQYDWLRSTGHLIDPPVPSLFTFNMPGEPITKLMGVSVGKVVAKIAGTKWRMEGPLLITHWGMSGPCILRLSAWAAKELADVHYNYTLSIDWVPDYPEQELPQNWERWRREFGGSKIYLHNPFGLPSRLWQYLLQKCEIADSMRWSELPAGKQKSLINLLKASSFSVKGKTTFKEEFVTCGGVHLAEVDVNSMQSKKHPGLFFAGELLNVDGITGGFNFQHAWTSGWIAAKAIAEMAEN